MRQLPAHPGHRHDHRKRRQGPQVAIEEAQRHKPGQCRQRPAGAEPEPRQQHEGHAGPLVVHECRQHHRGECQDTPSAFAGRANRSGNIAILIFSVTRRQLFNLEVRKIESNERFVQSEIA